MKKHVFHYLTLIAVILLLFATACKKEEPATKPSLSTTPASNITTTTATSGGVIADDGGATITANGVCWGKTENPTIEGLKTTESVSSGQFVSNLTGLDAGTTYHVRAFATNVVGTSYGADMTFLTLGQAPSGLTQTPTNITPTGAILNGTVNPNDLSTTVTFEYGTTTSYGSTAAASQSPVTGNAMVNVTAEISGLLPATTYHYRVKTVNSIGTTYSEDKTFTTLGIAPTATTLDATSKTSTGATLNGTVNANNTSTTVTFEYGKTTSYGQTVTATQSPITGNTNSNVSAAITGLTAGTTYHFRVKAVNSVGTTNGSDMTFTTVGLAPTATTLDATSKTTTGATLNASVNANMASTTVTFEYGTTTSYGQTVTATPSPVTGNSNTNVSAAITGLTAGTTYHFRVKAVNSVSTTYGSDVTFTTLYPLPPTSGLIGYWSFTGNANDASGNNINGTVIGAVLTTDRFNNNNAYTFDGVNDYIDLGNSSLINSTINGSFSVSIWFQTNGTTEQRLFAKRNVGYQGFEISKFGDEIGIFIGDGSKYHWGPIESFNQNVWNHYVCIIDKSQKKIFSYLNGILAENVMDISDINGIISNNETANIGINVQLKGAFFGKIDDIRIYNRILTNAEIQQLYHENGY